MFRFFAAFAFSAALYCVYANINEQYISSKCGFQGGTDATLTDCRALVASDWSKLQFNRTCKYRQSSGVFHTGDLFLEFPPMHALNNLRAFSAYNPICSANNCKSPSHSVQCETQEVNLTIFTGCLYTTSLNHKDHLGKLRDAAKFVLGCGDESKNKVNGWVTLTDGSSVCLADGKSW
jgi:hypothetical protein